MKNKLPDSRKHLRQRALQAIVSIEFGQDPLQAAQFSYLYDQEEVQEVEIPLFLLQLVTGVAQHRDDLDKELVTEIADIIHYAVALAAINHLDLTKTILEKDKAASIKYGHTMNLTEFIQNKYQ